MDSVILSPRQLYKEAEADRSKQLLAKKEELSSISSEPIVAGIPLLMAF
jgi:hypothetical protein